MSRFVPNLIIPGFAKSGTSSLFYYLSKHPSISSSIIKEPHVYSFGNRYTDRFLATSEYSFERLYANSQMSKYRMEASTSYAQLPDVPKKIKADSLNCKIVFILRDPIDRIYSHYSWLYSLGYVNKPFRAEIMDWVGKSFSTDPIYSFRGNFKFYTDISMYHSHLINWINEFNADSIHILTYEELRSAPESSLNKIFDFLGIEYKHVFDNIIINKTNMPIREIRYLDGIGFIKQLFPISTKDFIKKKFVKVFYKEFQTPAVLHEDKVWLYEILERDIYKAQSIGIDINYWPSVRAIQNGTQNS